MPNPSRLAPVFLLMGFRSFGTPNMLGEWSGPTLKHMSCLLSGQPAAALNDNCIAACLRNQDLVDVVGVVGAGRTYAPRTGVIAIVGGDLQLPCKECF